MCGIAGLFGTTLTPSALQTAVEGMAGALVHRGPDDLGTLVDGGGGSALACRRLSLVGIANGHQPLSNEDGTVSVVCNGEIYNHRELGRALTRRGHRFATDSDAEVIVHLYEEHGPECFGRLDGMFAVAVLDRRANRLVLARDGCGMKQLCHATTSAGFVFASEAKALFASGLVSPRPDWSALDTYLAVGFVPSPRSCFEGVRKVRPGSVLVVDGNGIDERTFWRLRYSHSAPRQSDDDYVAGFKDALRRAVASHLQGDTRVGAYLSGGWDSSIVATMAAGVVSGPLATFSVVLPENPSADEGRYSRLMASFLGSEHREVTFRSSDVPRLMEDAVWYREEPFTGPGMIELQLASLTSQHVKAVLSGQGSDELFGGYPWHQDNERWFRLRTAIPPPAARLAARAPLPLAWRFPLGVLGARDAAAADAEWMRALTVDEKDAAVRPGLRPSAPDAGPYRVEAETLETCQDPFQRRAALDFTRRLADGLLVTSDRMAMAHSLEVRMPFLDRAVVDYAAALPTDLKVRQGQEKYVVSRVAACLPQEIASRRKFGLQYPLADFLRGPLQPFVRELVLDSPLARDCLDRRAVERLLRRWLRPARPELKPVWALAMLAAWWNRFIAPW